MRQDGGVFQSSDFGFGQDAEILLGGGVGSFGGGAEGLDFLVAIGAPDNFVDQPGEILDGHVSGVAIVVDPVFAVQGIFDDIRII